MTPPLALPRPAASHAVRARLLLLVIDPEPATAELLYRQLNGRQVDVVLTDDPADGLFRAGGLLPDAVLAAADVPPMRGAEIARTLNARAGIPTIIGVDTDADAKDALACGAHGCVGRPYRTREVLTLLRGIAPDTPADFPPAVRTGALRLDPAAHEVRMHGRRITMPMREFELLHLLMQHPGRVLTRQQICQLLWSAQGETSNTLTVHVRRLRKRLGDDPANPRIIVAVRGLGYRFEPPA